MRRAAALSAVLVLIPLAVEAQTSSLLNQCVEAGTAVPDPTACHVLVRSAAELQATIGLAGTWGGVLPGAAHSLGKRFQDGPPRFSLSGRAGFLALDTPGGGQGGTSSSRSLRPALQASFAGGVFEGLRLRPAVGGVLALDLFGTLAWISTPSEVEGGGVQGGLGVRLGLLRESFDVPALTLVASHSWAGQSAFDSGTPSTRVQVTPRSTALRITISKDVGGFGLGASLGRDWYRGRAALIPPASAGELVIEDETFAHGRWVGAVTGMLNYLVLFVEGELGWAPGISAAGTDELEPGGSIFASLSARLVF